MAIELEMIEFKDFQEPAVGAENLNKMQQNIKKSINEVANSREERIFDTTEITDKVNNTYSARVIDELISNGGSPEIIENANGKAIKYPDGRMLCLINVTTTDFAVTNSFGSGLYFGAPYFAYPVSFVNDDITPFWGMAEVDDEYCLGSVKSTSRNTIRLTVVSRSSKPTGSTMKISCGAWGFWKE